MRIGIIGSSSQVGASLAFYLKHFTTAEPVCFIRSSFSKMFFDISGLECRQLDLRDTEAIRAACSDLDGVIDCTYPGGQLYEIPRQIGENLSAIIPALPTGTFFVYMSTIMAFGMPTGHKTVENFRVPQTTYAYIKRKAEKITSTLCRQHQKRGFIFRLGQVHGFLQSVNGSYREKMIEGNPVILDGKPEDQVNVIFIPTLAAAILKIASGETSPGTYSLVNSPQWTLKEIYSYYGRYYGFENELVYRPFSGSSPVKNIKSAVVASARKWRPLFESYILMRNEKLYQRVKGRYRVGELANFSGEGQQAYTDFHLLGKNPGKMIEGLDSSMDTVLHEEKRMESLYTSLLDQATKISRAS